MRTCIDLKKEFGSRYLIDRDPAYFAEYGPKPRVSDPWYWIIRTRTGHIYPQGGTKLAVSVDGHRGIVAKLKRLPFCQLQQDGTDGATFIFDVAECKRVARVVKPRRRRQLSPAQRACLLERGKSSRFSGAQSDLGRRERDIVANAAPMPC